jgi:uncharacterized Fe-S cluster-containing radical SAM superfamily protein
MVDTARKPINTDSFSQVMRRRGVDVETERLLITNFSESQQELDLTEPANCDGFGRIRHFSLEASKGWPSNPLPIIPAARGLALDPIPAVMRAQVFQNAVCNWRCWYCFVDFELLAGNRKHSKLLSADELLDLFLAEPEPPAVLDLSGGQPDLVPEWVQWTVDALRRRGLQESIYLWSDDNLSTDYFFSALSHSGRRLIDDYPLYGKVCCFKGFDGKSFAFNTTAAETLFDRQFEVMGRLIRETSIDLYCYVTLTTPHAENLERSISLFVDRLQTLDPALPLRTVPLEVVVFSPVRGRLKPLHDDAFRLQWSAVAAWQAELEQRFTPVELALPIDKVSLRA